MSINLIYACNSNNVIGNKGNIPWNIPQDLRLFKKKTDGCAIVMGRKTWESLPKRPLKNRHNIIVTSHPEDDREGVSFVYSVEQALEYAKELSPTVWVIGGQEILKDALPYANEVHVTHVQTDCEGDTFAPSTVSLALNGFKVDTPKVSVFLKDELTGQLTSPVAQVCVYTKESS